jgi:hypothetical protein
MTHQIEEKSEFQRRDRWLIAGFIAAPMAALTHLTVSYSLVPESCERGTKLLLHASSVVFFLTACIAALIGWRTYSGFVDSHDDLWKERTRWFASVVMIISIASAVVIVAMEIPNFIHRTCD